LSIRANAKGRAIQTTTKKKEEKPLKKLPFHAINASHILDETLDQNLRTTSFDLGPANEGAKKTNISSFSNARNSDDVAHYQSFSDDEDSNEDKDTVPNDLIQLRKSKSDSKPQ